MLRVLVVSPGNVSKIADALKSGGFAVFVTHGDGGSDEITGSCDGAYPDVIVADLRRAFDSHPLRALLRPLTVAVPVVALLSARNVAARDWFALADEFLAPPHDPGELLARVRHVLFRRRQVESGDVLHFRDLTLHLSSGTARTSDTALSLTPREWELLRFLLTHRGKWFAREQLIDFVWGVDYDGGARTVDIHVRRLRAKLPPQASAALVSRRGLGYGFSSAGD